MKTFLFYDIETSGLHSAFDQILTFAAIRTDAALKELERVSVVVQLRPDVVPAPGAFITHRLSLSALARGEKEYRAALRIHQLINTPGTISVGYNTLGFDDEFLRFTFYRNLLDPYTHQYKNGCSRMDILPLAVLYRLFAPLDIHWPSDADGKPSIKLELISRDNALVTSGRAHDAMTDVEATLALARRLRQRQEMWDFCRTFFLKEEEVSHLARLKQLTIGQDGSFYLGIMVSVAFGGDRHYMAPVLRMGPSRVYGNQTLWLRLDDFEFPGGEGSGPVEPDKVFVIRKKNGEPPVILPPLERFWGRLAPEHQVLANRNLAALSRHTQWLERVVEYHRDYAYPVVPDVDVDAGLYQDGFFSSGEKREMAQFHLAVPGQGLDCIRKMKHPRVRSLAARILFRNFPEAVPLETFSKEIGFDGAHYMDQVRCEQGAEPIKGFRGEGRYGPDEALKEIDALLHGKGAGHLDDEQIALIGEIAGHVRGM